MAYSLSKLDPALLHDAVQRHLPDRIRKSVVSPSLRPAGHEETVTGLASTLRLRRVERAETGGAVKVMDAYDALPAGSILVVEVVGDPGGGVIGDLVAHRLSRIGLLGAIVDGPVRDTGGILSYGLPVWARDITLCGMVADELQVEVGVDVTIGGVHVSQNDLISAGRDGICVVGQDSMDVVLNAAQTIAARESEAHSRIASGGAIKDVYLSVRKAVVPEPHVDAPTRF